MAMGKLIRDPEKAFQLIKKAAEKGYTYAQSILAGMYKNGEGEVAKDLKESFLLV